MKNDIDELRIERQFDTYCMKVIKAACNEICRRNSRRIENECFLEDMHPSEREWILRDDSQEKEETFYRIDSRYYSKEMLDKALQKLTDEENDLLDYYYCQDMTDSEIGRILNITRRLATYRRNRVLEKLKRILEEENEKHQTEKQ